MKHIDPDHLVRSKAVFITEPALTMADVRRLAEADAELTETQRRDLVSAVNRIEHLFQVPAEQLEAAPHRIRALFGKATAAKLKVSEKTLANIRSLIVRAIGRYARTLPPLTKRIPIDDKWRSLLDRIETNFQRQALHRLATYCSVMKIAPEQVGQETLLGLHAALEAEEIVKKPRGIIKNTIANWNRSKRTVPGWPRIVLSSPFILEPFTLPLSTFPQSFQEDVGLWKERMLRPDLLDDDAPIRPLRPVTVEHRVLEFRQFGSALVRGGQLPLDAIINIGVMLEPENFKAAIRIFLNRAGRTDRLHNLARSMRLIGKHYCHLDEKTLDALDKICRRLAPQGGRQLTERNRQRLGQFDDPLNVAKLLQFPAREAAAVRLERNPYRAAKRMECAVAVALLTHCGLRARTLRTLELGDFRWLGKGSCQLHVPREKHKTDRPLEFELDVETAGVVRKFVADFRGRMPGAEGPYLFPAPAGGPRSKNAMYESIRNCMRKRVGLEMNPHLFRHALAKIAVEADPGAYLAVSRVLGHSTMKTTMAHYLGTETKAAGRHIDKLLAKAKTGAE